MPAQVSLLSLDMATSSGTGVLTCQGPLAAAVVFGFICIALAFGALLAVLMLESRAWRHTMQAESEEWRSLLKEMAHDAGIGLLHQAL